VSPPNLRTQIIQRTSASEKDITINIDRVSLIGQAQYKAFWSNRAHSTPAS